MCEDGYQIILKHFRAYRQRIRSSQGDSVRRSVRKVPLLDSDANPQRPTISREPKTRLTLNEKLPLAMLLCLVADGRQLTLEEIDRVLVYLLEKKAKMLTLPEGTLPPLPAYYANGKRMDNRDRTSTGTSSFHRCPTTVIHAFVFSPRFSVRLEFETIDKCSGCFVLADFVPFGGIVIDDRTDPSDSFVQRDRTSSTAQCM